MMKAEKDDPQTTAEKKPLVSPASRLVPAILFGLIVGFLLQKGGVGKYNILLGQLLLDDWTVAKIMLTAILVGMLGVMTLYRLGKVQLDLKPTRLGANILGGLLFGAGFALVGYCPGTGAVALGQGSWDALFGIAGLVAGSWFYAVRSGRLQKTVEKWGDLGELRIPDLVPLSHNVFVIVFAAVLTAALILLEQLTA